MNKTFATLTTACFAGALVLGGATVATATEAAPECVTFDRSSLTWDWNNEHTASFAGVTLTKPANGHNSIKVSGSPSKLTIFANGAAQDVTGQTVLNDKNSSDIQWVEVCVTPEPVGVPVDEPDPTPDPVVIADILCRVTASTVIGGTAIFTVAPADCNVPTAPISFSSYELENKLVHPFDKQVAFDHATDAGVAYGAGDYTLAVALPDCNWQSDLYWSPNGENQVSAPHSHPVNGMNVGWDYTEGNDCTVVVPPVEPPVVEPPVVTPPVVESPVVESPVEPTTPVAAFVPQQLPTLPVTELAYTGSSPLIPAGIASLLLAVGGFLLSRKVRA